MKLQTIACAVAIATGGFFFSHAINEEIAANHTAVVANSIVPTQEQALFRVNWRPGRSSALFKSAFRCCDVAAHF